jgi:hypothetical protein
MNQDFEDILSHLNAEAAKYLIVGGYAVAIHAQPRATKDLDIFIGTDRANGAAVWRALAKFGAPIGDIPPDEMAEPGTFFTWGNPPFRVDIITRISGVEFDDAWSRRLMHGRGFHFGFRLLLGVASTSLARRRLRLSQAMVRSTVAASGRRVRHLIWHNLH